MRAPAAYLDFLGLAYISASLERLIVFLYPTVVVMLSALIFKRRGGAMQLPALTPAWVRPGVLRPWRRPRQGGKNPGVISMTEAGFLLSNEEIDLIQKEN